MTSGRWLLIGAAGLVGTHLREALGSRPASLTAHRVPVPGATRLDLRDSEAVFRTVRDAAPDVILLAGADAWVERCERRAEATRAVNVDAARHLRAAAPDAVLVVFSSEYVYDGRRGGYREEDPVSPINEYGRQKVALEEIARGAPRHLICRVSGVYGWSEARTSFVAQVADRLRDGRRFAVPNDQLITPTPAAGLARAVVELVERGVTGTLHVAGPEILGRDAFARRIAAAFDLDASLIDPVTTASLDLSAARPPRAGLLTGRLRAALGRDLAGIDDALAALRRSEPRV